MAKEPNYSLDRAKANEMLNNILDNCNLPPSSETLEADIFMANMQRRRLSVCKFLAIVFLIAAVMSPLLFKADPQFKILTSSKTVAVSSHILYDDCFVMTLSGSADYSNIYAKKNDGAIIFPDQSDSSTGVVIFPYDAEALNIYIPTQNGECIQAILNETVN